MPPILSRYDRIRSYARECDSVMRADVNSMVKDVMYGKTHRKSFAKLLQDCAPSLTGRSFTRVRTS